MGKAGVDFASSDEVVGFGDDACLRQGGGDEAVVVERQRTSGGGGAINRVVVAGTYQRRWVSSGRAGLKAEVQWLAWAKYHQGKEVDAKLGFAAAGVFNIRHRR